MPFLSPMLAKPLPKPGAKKPFILEPGMYAAEEKYDGHRIGVEVNEHPTSLLVDKGITAWSRLANERILPSHILEALNKFPYGQFDGELLVPGKRSYGVTEITNGPDLVYFVFDVLRLDDGDITQVDYNDRRTCLEDIFSSVPKDGPIRLAPSTNVNTWEEVMTLRDEVWSRDGEGLILKRRNALYQIGKRSADFIKIKVLQTSILTVIGFVPSHGLINNRGLYATIVIQDEDGNVTTVKTRNDVECRALEAEANKDLVWNETRFMNKPMKMIVNHPAVGRKLQIEFQERTMPDNNYRHPRFDHWV